MITFKAKTPDSEIINSALSSFNFPAGEAHTKHEERRELELIEIAIIQPDADSIHNDLFQLAMWGNYIAEQSPHTVTIAVIPYFPGARADRGLPFGLQVYAEFIGHAGIDHLYIFDPHSPVTLDALNYEWQATTPIYSDELFRKAHIGQVFEPYTGIIAPDKGAVIRAGAVAVTLEIPLYVAEKTRDFETGKLTGFKVEDLPSDGKFLVVDDICDAGGTFKGLATASGLPPEQLDLFVSHGVFSRDALTELPKYFGHIYTTNSYKPHRPMPSSFTRVDVVRLLLDQVHA